MIKPLDFYDKIILSFSGGKDSIAFTLFLLENGAKSEQIEIWHQSIDGKGDTYKGFFDWPSTDGYVKQFAEHFGLYLSYQWRAFGFYGELMRNNSLTNDVYVEKDGNIIHLPSSKHGNKNTRLKWPAKTANLQTRWCSSYLKIDVASRAINNNPDLKNKKILFITGERREESTARSKYKEYELHRTNTKSRLVHHWRPIIDWKEQKVWDIIKQHEIMPHPAYYLGFPRLSCRSCIFYSKNHWATLHEVAPDVVNMLYQIEEELDFTLDNKFTIPEMVQLGKSKITPDNKKYITEAISDFSGDVTTNGQEWELPIGAFGEGGGAI